MRTLLCAWRWAHHVGAPLLVVWQEWEPVEDVPFSFYDFFDRDRVRRMRDLVIVEAGPPVKGGGRFIGGGHAWDAALAARPHWREERSIAVDELAALPGETYIHYRGTSLLRLPGEESLAEADALAPEFARLPIHPAIEEAVRAALPDPATPPVALHIRRGDVIGNLFGRTSMLPENLLASDIEAFVPRYTHLNAYRRAVDARFPDAPISIFSDDPACRAELAARYAGRIRDPHQALDGFPALTHAQRAFAEFLVIVRSRALLSARSQFSLLPAQLGNIWWIDVRSHCEAAEAIAEIAQWVRTSPRCAAADRPAFLARILDRMAHTYRHLRLTDQAEAFTAEARRLGLSGSRC